MNLNLIVLQANAASGAATNANVNAFDWTNIIFIVAIIGIFYFMLIRPQQKRQKQIREEQASIKKGDNVVTQGGIFGRVKEVKDDSFLISVSDNTTIRVVKTSVFKSVSDAQQTQQSQEQAK